MRLIIATPLYPPEIGGPATYAKLLSEELPKKGIEIDLVKFSAVRYLPKIIRHCAYYRRVLLAARRADAVLALDPVSVGLPAMWAAKKAKKTFVVKIVGDYAWEQGQQRFGVTQNLDEFVTTKKVPFPVRLLRRIQIRVARSAEKVIVPSFYLKNIVMTWGIPKEKIEVIYNAMPLEELGTVPDAVVKLPRPLVMTAGRFVPWKNMDGVIDAVASIPDASLAIVGDGPLRAELERYANKSIPNRTIFTGRLSHKDTLATKRFANVFVLNSSYEGLSHHLIEVLSLGIPVIATRAGGNPELVIDNENGLLVPVDDTSALINALERILSDEELRARLSSRATESAKRFSIETMIAQTSDVIHNL